jgi:hypothetical protein
MLLAVAVIESVVCVVVIIIGNLLGWGCSSPISSFLRNRVFVFVGIKLPVLLPVFSYSNQSLLRVLGWLLLLLVIRSPPVTIVVILLVIIIHLLLLAIVTHSFFLCC